MLKKLLSFCLALAIVFTTCIVPVFAEEKPVYTFIGDSMSYNFAGRHDWDFAFKNTYPERVASECAFRLTETFDGQRQTKLGRDPFALPGGRTTELYYLLDNDYKGDEYTSSFSFKIDKAKAQEIITNSDVISLMLGEANLTCYFAENLLSIITDGKLKYSADLDQLGDVYIPGLMDYINNLIHNIDIVIDPKTDKALMRALDETEEEKKEVVNLVLDDIKYAVLSGILHFDKSVESIHKLNPDARVYVLGLFNPIENITASFTYEEKKYIIPLNKIFGLMLDAFNFYMSAMSPQRANYVYVDPVRDVETYGDKIVIDNELATKVIAEIILDNIGGQKNDALGTAETIRPVVQKIVANKEIDITRLLDEISEGGGFENIANIVSGDGVLAYLAVLLGEEPSYIEELSIHLFVATSLKGLYVHPTDATHEKVAANLIAAIKKEEAKEAAVRKVKENIPEPIQEVIEESLAQTVKLSKSIIKTSVENTVKTVQKIVTNSIKMNPFLKGISLFK